MDDTAEKGIIYVLVNDAMPGLLKIGATKNLAERLARINACTEVPIPFQCFYAAIVESPWFVEQQLHSAFAPHRVSPRREFFRVPAYCVVAAIDMVAEEVVAAGGYGEALFTARACA
jgi:hypothetical protein